MNKNTYEDHLKYIKMIEQEYSIDYICKHCSISHKDLEVLWHRYQKDVPSGLVKKVRRLKDRKMRNKPSNFWGSYQREGLARRSQPSPMVSSPMVPSQKLVVNLFLRHHNY